MAKNKRGRKYRMTPRRKAALRKAQIASARKRRGHRRKRVAKVAGVIGATLVAGGTVYAGGKFYNSKKNKAVIPQAPTAKMTVINLDDTEEERRLAREAAREARHAKNAIRRAKHAENAKKINQRKRMKYWQNKPVSGGHKIPPISTAGSRKAGAKRRKKR